MKNADHGHTREAPDELLSRILGGEVGTGAEENALLAQFQRGYPVSKLRTLLQAKDDRLAAVGMWIASELGGAVRPLFRDIVNLMQHPAMKVRFYSLDCVLVCADREDNEAINRGMDLIDDDESAVRWKALFFLAALQDEALRAALTARILRDGDRPQAQKLLQLSGSAVAHDSAAILTGLTHNDLVVRRFAAGMAARMARRDSGPLSRAAQSVDSTISQFAKDMLARLEMESGAAR
jgi:hypothetical protein